MVHICICAFCTVAEPLYSISGSGLLTKRCTVLFNFGLFGMVHMPSIASMLEVLVSGVSCLPPMYTLFLQYRQTVRYLDRFRQKWSGIPSAYFNFRSRVAELGLQQYLTSRQRDKRFLCQSK